MTSWCECAEKLVHLWSRGQSDTMWHPIASAQIRREKAPIRYKLRETRVECGSATLRGEVQSSLCAPECRFAERQTWKRAVCIHSYIQYFMCQIG